MQPEGLREQQRVGRLRGDPVDDLAPELGGHRGVELLVCGRADSAREGMAPPWPGSGIPEALDVAPREHHGGVEADDREAARDLEDLSG